MAHGVVNTTKVKSTRVGHIYSLAINEDIDNGSIGSVGDLLAGEMEVRAFVKPLTADLTKRSVVVIATPELIYDQSTKVAGAFVNFFNAKNIPMVGLSLVADDELEVSVSMIDAIVATVPVVGNYLVAQNASCKLKEVATLVGTEKFVAKIEYIRASGISTFIGGNALSTIYNLVGYRVIQN